MSAPAIEITFAVSVGGYPDRVLLTMPREILSLKSWDFWNARHFDGGECEPAWPTEPGVYRATVEQHPDGKRTLVRNPRRLVIADPQVDWTVTEAELRAAFRELAAGPTLKGDPLPAPQPKSKPVPPGKRSPLPCQNKANGEHSWYLHDNDTVWECYWCSIQAIQDKDRSFNAPY